MKRYLFILLLLSANYLFAQNRSGVYLNWKDYNSNKLSYSFNCDSSSGKIRLNDFFSKNYIDVIHDKNKIRLNKDSIFGYRDCKQKDYRFFKSNEKEYRIAENKNIVIYIADVPVAASSGKQADLVPAYFFSKTLDSDIYPLTIINLKKVFPDNLIFHDKLDLEFKNDKNISSFDDIHKMYKINYLLSKSKIN